MKPQTHDIVVTHFDHHRLKGLVHVMRERSAVDPRSLDALELELERAQTMPAHVVPSDVITMNSTVMLQDIATGERSCVTLVFPDAPAPHGRQVPVLSSLGLALLGCRSGHIVELSGAGRPQKLRVEAVEYQPEARGNFFM
ncbi:MAG TPA: GreA/GreB family elongation factor [Polyangiales bacterium]|nr:GreA/GreB family elongation factor [Polyangiales bacterium]